MPRLLDLVERESDTLLSARTSGFKSCEAVWLMGETPSRGAFPMILKQISLEQRPRERAKEKGIESLNDAELLALILENGSKGENVIDLSNRLISTFGIGQINSLSLHDLIKIK